MNLMGRLDARGLSGEKVGLVVALVEAVMSEGGAPVLRWLYSRVR